MFPWSFISLTSLHLNCFLSQSEYLLSILIFWSNSYQLHVIVLILRAHDVAISGEMNGKLPSKNSFWKWISCTEGENDEMAIANSRERSWFDNVIYILAENFIFSFRIYKIFSYLLSLTNFSSTKFPFALAFLCILFPAFLTTFPMFRSPVT